MKNRIQFVSCRDPFGREIFQVLNGKDFLIGEIRFNKASKDFHCIVKKQFRWEFAQRHRSIKEAEKYFINRFN